MGLFGRPAFRVLDLGADPLCRVRGALGAGSEKGDAGCRVDIRRRLRASRARRASGGRVSPAEGVATLSGAPKPAPEDEFMFIRLVFWPYILLGVSALFAGAAYVGYPLFGR